jgi:hypothetical protein
MRIPVAIDHADVSMHRTVAQAITGAGHDLPDLKNHSAAPGARRRMDWTI